MRSLTCAKSMLFLLFLCPIFLMGQDTPRFVATNENIATTTLDRFFQNYQVVNLPAKAIDDYVHAGTNEISMNWFFPDGTVWPLKIEAAPLRTSDFTITALLPEGQRKEPVNNNRINTFRNSRTGEDIRLTVNGDFIYGYVQIAGEEWYIEPVNRFVETASSTAYLVYRTVDVLPQPDLKCGQTETARLTTQAGGARGGCVEVDLAIAADYTMYEYYESAGAVLAQIEGVLNNVNGNFDDDFSQNISLRISELVIPACESCDPWYADNDALTLLENFREWSLTGGFSASFDLGQFWSRRNYHSQGSGSIVGLAYVGAICSDNAFQILEDFTGSAGYLRVMTAHEIGHNFGCNHNYNGSQYECFGTGRPAYIMDPTINLSTDWSRGEWDVCDNNAADVIDGYLASNECLAACTAFCEPATDLVASLDRETPAFSLQWSAEEPGDWWIFLENTTTGEVDTFLSTEPYWIWADELDLCSVYRASVQRNCETSTSGEVVIDFNTENNSKLKLEDLKVMQCEMIESSYDLNLSLSFETAYPEGFTVVVDEENYWFAYEESPQTVLIPGLNADGRAEIPLSLYPDANESISCGYRTSYRAPEADCMIIVDEDFNNCGLPLGWQCVSDYALGMQWNIGDSTRLAANFGGVQNTINGSCMLYFDDDLMGPVPGSTGTAFLYTPVYNLQDYEEIALSLVYNFNAFYSQPYSQFAIEVFDGEQWVSTMMDDSSSGCVPSNAWEVSCLTDYSEDLSLYANANFQIRFRYTDGGQWAEFVALDDFYLRAVKSTAQLPVEWAAFSAVAEKEQVRLDWTTAQEYNNEGFYVERSADGRYFSDISFIPSTGNHHEPQAYRYFDQEPLPGTSYYRLRQVDIDGTLSYSEVRKVTYGGAKTEWLVYPNPVGGEGQLQINWLQSEDHITTMNLLNVSGQLLQVIQLEANPGWATTTIDISNLPAGVYLLRQENGDVKRIIKARS